MDPDQTSSIGSPDLRKDALDDMLHRIRLQDGNPDVSESDIEWDQFRQQADSFIHAMESPIGILHRVGLYTIPDVHTYNTSTPVNQLCQPTVSHDEYNQFNLQNIKSPTPPQSKNNENILEDFKTFKRSCI